MTHLLKDMTKALNETDDMFPGIDSSAFDEHNKKPRELNVMDEIDRLYAKLRQYQDLFSRSYEDVRQIVHFLENNDALETGSPSPNDIRYSQIAWLEKKHPKAYDRLKSFHVKSDSKILDQLPKHLVRYERALERGALYGQKQDSTQDEIAEMEEMLK